MKAVILAGGRGERLRPLTDTRPKPLVPVLARPVMDYCLSLLAHHGVTEAFITTHYLAEQIRHRYGKSSFGMSLTYVLEKTPMGTAGGVKALEERLQAEEMFIVMSGDAVCDFDISRAVSFHREKKADATIILSSVKAPLEYGVVLQTSGEKIFSFSEKPDWSETLSDLANTGVYILSPSVLKRIPTDRCFDFAKDLFPLLLREGYGLYGYREKGYWCDIGKISTLYRCNLDLMHGRVKTYLPFEGRFEESSDGKGVSFIADGAHVEKGAVVRQNTVVSSGARLKEGCRVSGSMIMEKAEVRKGAVVKDAILCEHTTVGDNAVVSPGVVLGASSVLMKDGMAEKGKKYPPYTLLSSRHAFEEDGFFFTEAGTAKGASLGLTRTDAIALGNAFAQGREDSIGIMWDEKVHGSASFAAAFATGVTSGGKRACLLGEGCQEEAGFAACRYGMITVLACFREGKGIFYTFGKHGLPLLRKEILQISRHCEELHEAASEGSLRFYDGVKKEYSAALSDEMGEGEGQRIGYFGTLGEKLKKSAINAGFTAYNGNREQELSIEVFSEEVKLFQNGERLGDTEKIRLFVIDREWEQGRRHFTLPRSAPRFFTEHIENRGGSVDYFSLCHTAREEEEARKKGERERWLFDCAFLAARLTKLLKGKDSQWIAKAFHATPDLYISMLRYIPKEENKAKVLGLANALPETDKNVRLESGFFGIKIISEALSFEAALDNAYEYRGKLNAIEKKLGEKS